MGFETPIAVSQESEEEYKKPSLKNFTSSIADSFQDLPYQSVIIEFPANQHAPLHYQGLKTTDYGW